MHKLLLLTSILCCSAESARILGVFHTHGRSHFALGETLLKGLAAKGHQVTMMSPYPQKVPFSNYTDVYLDGVSNIFKKNRHFMLKKSTELYISQAIKIYSICSQEAEYLLQHKSYKNLLKSDSKFDIVIFDNCANYFHLGIAHHYGASSIIFTTSGINIATRVYSSNPFPPSYVPNVILPYSDEMNFIERLHNAWYSMMCSLVEDYVLMPRYSKVLKKYFPKAPSMEILIKNVSLVLANSHNAVETPRPILPIIKEIGGLHIKEPIKLPIHIQQFLDEAQDGAILFSLGSNVHMSELPPGKLEVFIKAFSKIPQRVLWKMENFNVSKQPENVLLQKWIPQNDVLAHPNVIAFITHGGVNSILEATYRGIPMLGIPFFGDQFSNVAMVVKMGHALNINLQDLTVDSLSHALHQIINNPKYAMEAKRRSSIIRDQPLKPLDKAIYWVEYVLRHKGAKSLRSMADNLSFWSYMLIDVVAFSVGFFILVILSVWYFIKWCIQFKKLKIKSN